MSEKPDKDAIIAELLDALKWSLRDLDAALAGRPIRDVPECVSFANSAIARAEGRHD